MTWEAVREQFPNVWAVFEAIHSQTLGDHFLIQTVAVIDTFLDFGEGWRAYQTLKQAEPEREVFLYHTSNEQLEVLILNRFGVRVADANLPRA